MTPAARKALREALGQESVQAVLLQSNSSGLIGQSPAVANTTTAAALTAAAPTVPPAQAPDPRGQWKKCTDGKPNCGLLHDTMSLQWGKFKDLVDELKAEIAQAESKFATLETNLKEQMAEAADEQSKCQTAEGEAISKSNTLSTEKGNKETEQ